MGDLEDAIEKFEASNRDMKPRDRRKLMNALRKCGETGVVKGRVDVEEYQGHPLNNGFACRAGKYAVVCEGDVDGIKIVGVVKSRSL